MTTYLSQIREVELVLAASERVGISRKEAARRILRTNETVFEGNVRRKLWSDFQKIYVWASEIMSEP